jgi:uncharacterized protein (DUF58 family)
MLVFVVPPLARSARLEAARLDLPVQLTGGGLIFLCVLALVAFAAWNTGNNLLFLIFSLMTSAVFVGWSAGRASLRDLVVTARFPDHIFAGEPAPAIISVQNVKRLLPSVSVLVEARSRLGSPAPPRRLRGLVPRRNRFEKRTLGYFMYVPRRARAEQMVEQTFARRGHVLVTGFELSTGFPFGFFRLRRRLRARDVEIVVYPKPRPASDELHLLPINAGRMASARRGAGQDLHSLRDYQPHDDVRHIDWKATARASRLTVREFAAEDERRVHVVLDTLVGEAPAAAEKDKVGVVGRRRRVGAEVRGGVGASASPAGGVAGAAAVEAAERFERGVTLAASLVAHFVEERAEVRLTLGGEGGAYGSGREHMHACLRRLALVAPDVGAQADAGREGFWEAITPAPAAAADSYVLLLTTAPPGSIPAQVWRASHVIYL